MMYPAPSRLILAAFCAMGLTACSTTRWQKPAEREPPYTTIYAVERDWHTDIALPAEALGEGLLPVTQDFPGVRFVVIGFGDRAYFQSRETDLGDMIAALFPGPSVLLVTALKAPPATAFGADNVAALAVSRAGLDRLALFLTGYFARDETGGLRPIGDGPYPGSEFFQSPATYDVFHTCNTFAAEALAAAGLPITSTGVIFAGQVMGPAQRLARRQQERERRAAPLSGKAALSRPGR
jgi:uncharacterized protein (TIGR02117 family)